MMQNFYNSLSEKDRRRYAAIEAHKLGRGGIQYIAEVLECAPKTIRRGIRELKKLPNDDTPAPRIRKPGGGRKPYDVIHPDIDAQFQDVLADRTAGDPMRDDVLWTDLTPREIAEYLTEDHSVEVSEPVVRKLLKKHSYRQRKAQKRHAMKQVPERNEQFENIARLKREFIAAGNPAISIDTKKKEYIGNFYRPGHLYTREEIQTFDHDFNSFADGIVIPYGIYDIQRNTGYLNLGVSHDTGEFVCDSIRNWWYNQGSLDYPQTTTLLILCDSGGSSNCRHYIFKQDLQMLADELGFPIRVAHYPPYTSKYNPIEHRLFPHVARACQGVIFTSLALVKALMERTKTQQGLKVVVQIIDKVYEIGRKVAEDFKETIRIVFDEQLPQWNYTAVPNREVI